jgi:hypothetical protein
MNLARNTFYAWNWLMHNAIVKSLILLAKSKLRWGNHNSGKPQLNAIAQDCGNQPTHGALGLGLVSADASDPSDLAYALTRAGSATMDAGGSSDVATIVATWLLTRSKASTRAVQAKSLL